MRGILYKTEGGTDMKKDGAARVCLVASMCIFGTIGLVRRWIGLPSGTVALARAVIGSLFLLALLAVKRTRPDWPALRRNGLRLILSGAAMGLNWVLLFEAYSYTTVATATLCYYTAPIAVILVSPLLFGEKLTVRKWLCVGAAALGIVLVSGILETASRGAAEMKGILFGLGAAGLYAFVIIMNKKITGISPLYRTAAQLTVSAAVLLPYSLLADQPGSTSLSATAIVMLSMAGIVHTGVAYTLYFGSMDCLKAQTIALYSYIDPILAIILSALVLGEPLGIGGILGAVLILGAAWFSERETK